MLTMRFLDVRNLRRPPLSSPGNEAAPAAAPDLVADNSSHVRWSVRCIVAGKEYRTRYVHLPRDRTDKVCYIRVSSGRFVRKTLASGGCDLGIGLKFGRRFKQYPIGGAGN